MQPDCAVAVERMWHMEDSQGQIMALAFSCEYGTWKTVKARSWPWLSDLEERVLATHGLDDRVEARLVALHHVQQLDQRPPRLPGA